MLPTVFNCVVLLTVFRQRMYSFDGTFKSSPQVSLGNQQIVSFLSTFCRKRVTIILLKASAQDVVTASRKAREERQKTKDVEKAALKLQSCLRSFRCRVELVSSKFQILIQKILLNFLSAI